MLTRQRSRPSGMSIGLRRLPAAALFGAAFYELYRFLS